MIMVMVNIIIINRSSSSSSTSKITIIIMMIMIMIIIVIIVVSLFFFLWYGLGARGLIVDLFPFSLPHSVSLCNSPRLQHRSPHFEDSVQSHSFPKKILSTICVYDIYKSIREEMYIYLSSTKTRQAVLHSNDAKTVSCFTMFFQGHLTLFGLLMCLLHTL